MSMTSRLDTNRDKIFTDVSIVMIAETISLGILSLPSALAAIGIIPYVSSPKSYENPD